MKKILFLIPYFLFSLHLKAQTIANFCVAVTCPQSIQLPLDSIIINSVVSPPNGDTISSYTWKVTGVGGTLSTPTSSSTWVKNINNPGTYTFSLTVATKHGVTMTNPGSVVTVFPATVSCPPIPPVRTIQTIQVVIDGLLINIPIKGSLITYSDGSTQQN